MRNFVQTVVLAGAVLLLAACGGSGTAPDGAQAFTIQASEFNYKPNMIEVKAGKLVRLTFRNGGTMEHDFSIMEIPVTFKSKPPSSGHDMSHVSKEPQLHVSAVNGRSTTLEFTPTQAGTYEIFCTVAGHKDAGMTARLVVQEQ